MTVCNRKELAEFLGKTTPTIDAFVKEGMPFLARPSKEQGVRGEWSFDTGRVVEWYVKRMAPNAVKNSEKEKAEMRALLAEVTLKEVKAATALRQVVLVADAVELFEEKASVVKSRIRAIPGRVATAAAAESDPAKVLFLLKAEVDDALAEITKAKLKGYVVDLAAEDGVDPEVDAAVTEAAANSDGLDYDGY